MPAKRRSKSSPGPTRPGRRPERRAKAPDPNQPLTRRARLFRRVMQVAPVRRFYARRLIRFMEKSKKKGRDLPGDLADLDAYLSKLPANQRRAMLEASLSGELDSKVGREVRRAASRQGRQKGRTGGGQRPGMPPIPGARPRPQ